MSVPIESPYMRLHILLIIIATDILSRTVSIAIYHGCGLGFDVSVSRRTNVSSRSHLEKSCQRLGLVSVSAIYVLCPRPIFGQIVQATVLSVNEL